MNYFIEGIQGSGKSTKVNSLLNQFSDYKVYREGDYSPVELAWCTYVSEHQYKEILNKYSSIKNYIIENSFHEENHYIIAYTKIITDIPGFHKDLEKYEIYNGNISLEEFKSIIINRFKNWNSDKEIFECSFFQNIIETLILFYELSDYEILNFYKDIKKALIDKVYKIVYIKVDNILKAEENIRKERCDDQGNEMWFPMMVKYIENSPYGISNKLKGMNGLVNHLNHRVCLELDILNNIFQNNFEIEYRII